LWQLYRTLYKQKTLEIMSKVTVVGAGNVGATCANVLAFNEVADEVVMLDVKEGVSEGKAMDMMQTVSRV
jgi:malate dehydrogenase